ncbi:hypothetical protein SDC9_65149 [bioreactor metagenome]|uniref:Uncharacterized protein n=1 Tax=bioreactor metagenome TaxID=1076179 RepID=A0A644XR97_9ZZZZ
MVEIAAGKRDHVGDVRVFIEIIGPGLRPMGGVFEIGISIVTWGALIAHKGVVDLQVVNLHAGASLLRHVDSHFIHSVAVIIAGGNLQVILQQVRILRKILGHLAAGVSYGSAGTDQLLGSTLGIFHGTGEIEVEAAVRTQTARRHGDDLPGESRGAFGEVARGGSRHFVSARGNTAQIGILACLKFVPRFSHGFVVTPDGA